MSQLSQESNIDKALFLVKFPSKRPIHGHCLGGFDKLTSNDLWDTT